MINNYLMQLRGMDHNQQTDTNLCKSKLSSKMLLRGRFFGFDFWEIVMAIEIVLRFARKAHPALAQLKRTATKDIPDARVSGDSCQYISDDSYQSTTDSFCSLGNSHNIYASCRTLFL